VGGHALVGGARQCHPAERRTCVTPNGLTFNPTANVAFAETVHLNDSGSKIIHRHVPACRQNDSGVSKDRTSGTERYLPCCERNSTIEYDSFYG